MSIHCIDPFLASPYQRLSLPPYPPTHKPRIIELWHDLPAGFVSFLTALALVVAATGISTNFNLLRLAIAIGLFLIGALSLLSGYRLIATTEIFFGIFYLPSLGIQLDRHFWVILDLIVVAFIIFWTYKTTDSYQKGTAFEKHVASLFPAHNFPIETRTHDSSKFLGRYVETDVDPDFVFRNKRSGRSFAIECKWRKGWAGDKSIGLGLSWDLWKAERYISYGVKNKMLVLVAFGIGGTPGNPNEVYFLEAEKLRYRFLKQSLIQSGKTVHQLTELKI